MKRLTLIALSILIGTFASAQKKPLDHSVYDGWQSVGQTVLSPDGQVLVYQIAPQEGDAVLCIRTFGKKPQTIDIPRGYAPAVLEDDSHVVCLIKPEFKKSKQERIRKTPRDKMLKDSLAIVNLASGEIRKFPNVLSFKASRHGTAAIAFATADTTFIPKKERKQKDLGNPLAVYHFQDGKIDTLKHIDKYEFAKDGATLSFVRKTGKKHSVPGFFRIMDGRTTEIPDTATFVSLPEFNETGTQALFLTAKDTVETGSRHAELFLFDVSKGLSSKIIDKDNRKNLPDNWGLTENSNPSFSRDGKKIFAGIQPFKAPKDTTLVPFETPGVDIWNWDAYELPPVMKKNVQRDSRRTYPCLVKDGQLIPLYTDKTGRLMTGDNGNADVALYLETVRPIETQWNSQTDIRISTVNVGNGSKKLIAEGLYGRPNLSPKAKYIIWWDYQSKSWTIHDIASGTTRNLTDEIQTNLWDEEDDHPMLPGSYGIAGWTADDKDVLLYDFYDIWRVETSSGKAVRLTDGRERERTYRYINTKDYEDEQGILPGETVLLSIFDNTTKENGIASLTFDKAKSLKDLTFGGYSFPSVIKAKNTGIYAYRKGNFQEPYDVYYSPAGIGGKKDIKLSSINPQQKNYNWGTVELYHWNAYDGTPLDGLLFRPEDFDPQKKYPVMIYFYEKNSETLFNYRAPAPSRSTVNIPFYVSRGYVVFIPDIVYTPGLPGESAYNCIVSGAESLGQFDWIDTENMAIQGQSWGGYQVAYLVTRTGLFKAAGAGAPVSNMTSAYGGIRWGTGISRQGQYEKGQSRIGRDLWHGTELYMENSPIFKLPEVTTPLLIMHNDNDGAVPWYQGIEMFMGLRRLGKPAWLLEYNGEEHNLVERRNCKDLSIRLQQFFDHYLKGAPLPVWMKDGIPSSEKDFNFGYGTAD